jgi:hypothetical protein
MKLPCDGYFDELLENDLYICSSMGTKQWQVIQLQLLAK